MNCPFYGRALYGTHYPQPNRPPFILFNQHGNQCAIITGSHSPCQMEMQDKEPDWQKCALVRQLRDEPI
jgi:hypothetical protein